MATPTEQDSPFRLIPATAQDCDGDARRFFQFSDGVVAASEHETHSKPYESGAMIPKMPWRPASVLSGFEVARESNCQSPRVGIFALPPDQWRAAASSIRDEIEFSEGTRPVVSNDVAERALQNCLSHIAERFDLESEYFHHGAALHNPGHETVTINRRTGKYIGLHLDSWDCDTIEGRQHTRTRVCINLGPASRGFLYVPFQLDEIIAAGSRLVSSSRLNPQTLLDYYFREFASLPIIRIHIPPGLCCTNRVRDSSRESSVVAGMHEHTYTPNLQDQELASL